MPIASGKTDSRMSIEPSSFKEELVAQNNQAREKPFAHGASSSVHQESQKNTEATWDHYLHISPDTSHCVEAVFSMVRKIYGRPHGEPMEDLKVNFGHLENVHEYHFSSSRSSQKEYDTNLRFVKNYLWKTTGQLFSEKQKS